MLTAGKYLHTGYCVRFSLSAHGLTHFTLGGRAVQVWSGKLPCLDAVSDLM